MTVRSHRLGLWVIWSLLVLLVASVVAGIMVGPVMIPARTVIASLFDVQDDSISAIHRIIVLQIRLPRVLLGLLVGSALAVSGAAMQGVFGNPLASPYILGIASGATAGAAVAILFASGSLLFLPMGAFIGASVAALAVFRLARGSDGRTSVLTLILAGVAIGALFSALTSFLLFLSSGGEKLSDVLFWIMGGLGRASWTSVAVLAPIVVAGISAVLYFTRDLNALALGEEGAQHVGVNPESLYRWLLVLTTLLTASAVAMAGTIGFIGLVVPHVMRLLLGPDHRRLIPASALVGGCFLIWSDMAARTVLAPAELPVGVITAFFGAPFFLYLLKTRGASL
ncbi:MAG: iron ABC transporter [Candidatus Atribacteria bacterium]|nr:MAG: iron ABC transporter [Candidatus Atribacteria bacterium]